MTKIYRIRCLRRMVLAILQRVHPGDITIHHHWTGERFTLHPFHHRSYWYHGRKRKRDTMRRYSDLIGKGDLVVEIGAHIGYVSLYLAHLVGLSGRVTVFEPGPNNLPYLCRNTAPYPQISIVRKAVTDHVGVTRFHVDHVTGQNSSLLEGYHVLSRNGQRDRADTIERSVIQVPCTSLDDFLPRAGLSPPSFVSIDAEGAELSVLRGMKDTLREGGIALMVEVTEQAPDVWALLRGAGFSLFRPDGSPVTDAKSARGDLFGVRSGDERVKVFLRTERRSPHGKR